MKNKNHSQPDLSAIQGHIDEVLGENFWNNLYRMIPKRGPNVDLYQTDLEGVIIAEIPGLQSPQDIKISIDANQLVLEGQIPYPYPIPTDQLLINERFLGSFKRVIQIPFSFTTETITADYRSGLLEIRLPKLNHHVDVSIQFDEE
ncbi:Hsp20/alpha crystallin family protein [Thermoflavimicrobium dichotomicum]|uniref:HSP20 family protein n=1 Tax=Thermoflavimicrobium dichotomicum TaxID=46223 RepID=A0A1I3P291_9BACL|nr:Hsp20/alpha crystallin family protein [Thermoflavimicrobium dichotomicum]SFJ15457.1 HSP20 family protein [Thermoflavimicrobium dichotomicum]